MTTKDLERELISKGGNLSGIYKITRKSDGKVYIGQSECIVKRILQHLNNKTEVNSEKIDGAIKVEGWANFTYEIELALPELNTEQLWLAESTYIAKYDSYNKGFNKTKGNHIGKYDHDVFVRKNVVSAELTKFIRDHFKIDLANKRVLLINLFDEQFVNVLKYNGCEVIQISKYFEEQKELGNYIMEELRRDGIMNTKFDLIIANPPYRSIGANITKTIVDNIEYDEYINLLPANDYIRNDDKDLYKYVELSTMKSLPNAFDDAAVTPLLARVKKQPHRYISWEEFQIETYSDASLKDYFYGTCHREHYAIDKGRRPQFSSITIEDNTNTILLGIRDMTNKHLSYDKQCDTYLWNAKKAIDINKLKSNIGKTGSANKQASHYFITFKTELEKTNFAEFMYSKDGFRFLSKIFTALNVDSMIATGKFLPKVDWTRSWTVEEILKDYGYTQKEINEVMADLVNYKGMEN